MSGFPRAATSLWICSMQGGFRWCRRIGTRCSSFLSSRRHRRRRQVARDVGDPLHRVVEAAVDPDSAQVLRAVGDLPEALRRAGVARPEEARAVALDEEAVGRNDVVHRDRSETHAAVAAHLADDDRHLVLQLVEADHRQQMVGEPGEVGPGVVVEQVPAQGVDRRRRGVDVDRLAELAEDVLDEERQRRRVIHVRMGQHDRVHEPLAHDRQALRERARIERDRIVEQQTGHAAVDTLAAVTSENLYFHRLPVIVLLLDFLRQGTSQQLSRLDAKAAGGEKTLENRDDGRAVLHAGMPRRSPGRRSS